MDVHSNALLARRLLRLAFSASSLTYFVGGVPLSRPFAVLLAAVKLTAPRSRSVPPARVLALHCLAGTPIHTSVHVSVA